MWKDLKGWKKDSVEYWEAGQEKLPEEISPYNQWSEGSEGPEENAMIQQARDNLNVGGNIYFNKKGKEISLQIQKYLLEIEKEIKAKSNKAEEVCKRRDTNFDEVLKDEWVEKYFNGETSVDELYSNSISLRAVSSPLKDNTINIGLGKALTNDINSILEAAQFIRNTRARMTALDLVAKHISPDEVYKLTFHDLSKFGFNI